MLFKATRYLPAVLCGLAVKPTVEMSSLKKVRSMMLQLTVDGQPVANGAIVRGSYVIMICDIAHSPSVKNNRAVLRDRDGGAIEFEVVSYDEHSHLLVLRLKSTDADDALESARIQQQQVQEGDVVSLVGVDCFGEQTLDQVTVVDTHLKKYHDVHRVDDVYVPPIHSFKVNYKYSTSETSKRQPSRVAFNNNNEVAGVCRGDNLSVCYTPHQLRYILDKLETTGSLQKDKLGATIKTSQTGNGMLKSPRRLRLLDRTGRCV